jgi:hypothetical protein
VTIAFGEAERQQASADVDQAVTLQPREFLVTVERARRGRLRGLLHLLIDDDCRRRRLASRPLAVERDEDSVEPLEHRLAGEAPEPIVYRLWSGPLEGDRDQLGELTLCRAWWSSNWVGLK